MTSRKNVRRHLDRAGNSIPAAAKKLGIGEGTVRRAVDRGEIAIIAFGGLRRISDAEIERVRSMFLGTAEPSRDAVA
jgi:excisionase family DNA binding protein